MTREFNSFGAFGLFLAEVAAVNLITNETAALKECAALIEETAKKKIGTYQKEAGPFAAWPELTESTKAQRVAQGYTENDPLLRSGEMRDTIENKVAWPNAYIGSDDDVALYQEMGTATVPPRSFLGAAAVECEKEVVGILGATAYLTLAGATQKLKLR